MDPFHFACPHCSSRLRVREKLLVGRQIDCPECGDLLVIVERPDGLGVERIERPAAAATAPAVRRKAKAGLAAAPEAATAASDDRAASGGGSTGGGTETFAALTQPGNRFPGGLRRILWQRRHSFAAVAVAGALFAGTLAIVFYPRSDESPVDLAGRAEPEPGPNGELPDQPAPGDAEKRAVPDKPRDEVELRLSKIGDALFEHIAAEQAFPPAIVQERALPAENRLGWMAVLGDRLDDDSAPAPLWNRPWNDPRNEGFVRRRLAVFQNSNIAQLTGDDGYPASHFAGVSGVGAEAAKLDPRDARAGIFNNHRPTRVDEIRDGASNTLLVMGVREHLGSWAAGGTSTVRGLDREPYVNGPDGFGTGSENSMLVLMADGSVKTIGAAMEPRLLRRMAAKADGLPLDESEPGEPGDRPSLLAGDVGVARARDASRESEAGSREKPDIDERPIDPEFAPEHFAPPAPKIDLAVSLKQPIARFDQPRSKPLEDVLVSVAEMAGTRITFDADELGPAAARLAEPMSLKLENTTVGDILRGLLRPAGLTFRIEDDHLRLVREE
jgi:DNA-directed RNA polymerase subunit RPC12/RpoP